MNAGHLGDSGRMPKTRLWKGIGLSAVGMAALLACGAAQAGFVSIVIRGSPTINQDAPAPGVTEFITSVGGDKAALSSSDVDGFKLSDIATLGITRVDDYTRFATAGPGANVGAHAAPYLNIWITDGLGNFAVAANEPSNAEWLNNYNGSYNITWETLKTKTVKLYENADLSWLPSNGLGLTFEDLANYVIQAPTAAEQTWVGLGSGAPRDKNDANKAYGVNWVFGDTLSNYVSGQPGFQVTDAFVTAAVPEPTTLALVGLALAGGGLARRRRTA